jgi:hypothetical protein
VPHEHPTAIGIDGEQPPIAVGADVNESGPNGHAEFYSICSTLALAHICGEAHRATPVVRIQRQARTAPY